MWTDDERRGPREVKKISTGSKRFWRTGAGSGPSECRSIAKRNAIPSTGPLSTSSTRTEPTSKTIRPSPGILSPVVTRPTRIRSDVHASHSSVETFRISAREFPATRSTIAATVTRRLTKCSDLQAPTTELDFPSTSAAPPPANSRPESVPVFAPSSTPRSLDRDGDRRCSRTVSWSAPSCSTRDYWGVEFGGDSADRRTARFSRGLTVRRHVEIRGSASDRGSGLVRSNVIRPCPGWHLRSDPRRARSPVR